MSALVPRLVIEEIDGTPVGQPAVLKVSNGSLTDNGDGSFTLLSGASLYIARITTTTSVDGTYTVILVDSTAGDVTVNLPAVSATNKGLYFLVKKISSDSNNVIVAANGSDTVDLAPNVSFNLQFDAREVVSEGANASWWLI